MIRTCLMLICGVVWLSFAGCQDEKNVPVQKASEPPPLPVEFVSVARQKVPIWLEYTGKTEASRRVEVRARVAGRLEQVLFAEGEYIEAGKTLFIIEQEAYEAALLQARARLERDQATLALARKDVERYRPLVAEGLAPRVTLEQYEARVAELEATIKSDQGAVRDAELNLSYTEVTAPISGRISRKFVDVGNIVGYGEKTVLTIMVADDPMYAYFNPTESQFQIMRTYKTQDNMSARVTIPGSAGGLIERVPLQGKVDFTDIRVDQMTGTITMRAEVANPEHAILEGTFVYVEVMVTDQVPLLMVPPAAVQEDQRSSYVYVVGDNDTAKRVDIERGYENRHYVMVRQGLEGGERVVVSGLVKIREGTKIDPSDATAAKGVMAQLAQQDLLIEKE